MHLNFHRAVFLALVAACVARTQVFSKIYSFPSHNGDPSAPLVQGFDGQLYGATAEGGYSDEGTVFKITTGGVLTPLNGAFSPSILVPASNGDIYGASASFQSYGVIFKLKPSGALTTFYTFGHDIGVSSLLQGTDGNLYGTAGNEIFKLTLAGVVTPVYTFGPTVYPGGLVEGMDGDFYGVKGGDGAADYGSVFKITRAGVLTTLHSFNFTDGAYPSGLVQASNGYLYGTTFEGGSSLSGCSGTAYKISPQGVFTSLYSFDGTQGCYPAATLIQATNGNLYGSASYSTSTEDGTLFELTLTGVLTTIVSFDGVNGGDPYYALFQATDGNLYGTTPHGGEGGFAFSVALGLNPFVTTVPVGAGTGKLVQILGTNLTGATAVTFNGVPARFSVVSSSQITAGVPAGATTGKIQVTTPNGTLLSNVPFRVVN
jgi:uncharacterized repeat protein (TIGR03803 family)